jgi:hypothetical protein
MNVTLIASMNFHQSIQPLDDLYSRSDLSRFEGNVHHLVDFDPRRDFDPQRGICWQWQKTLGFSPQICRMLALQPIDKNVTTQVDSQNFLKLVNPNKYTASGFLSAAIDLPFGALLERGLKELVMG